jgi:putative transposase
MDDWHYQRALRYAEQNPVRARMVALPWEYPWSSAAAHTGADDPSGLLNLETWQESITDIDWKMILTENLSEEMTKALRLHTQTGRPWMDDRILEELEVKLGRRLRPLPPFRPRKTVPEAGVK